MKITKSKLKQLIREELAILNERDYSNKVENALESAARHEGINPERVLSIYNSLSPEDKENFNNVMQSYVKKFMNQGAPGWAATHAVQVQGVKALARSRGDMRAFERMLSQVKLEEGATDSSVDEVLDLVNERNVTPYDLPPLPPGIAYPDQDGIYPMLDDDGFPIYEYQVYDIPKYKEFFDWLRSQRPQGPPVLEPEPEEPYFNPDPQPEQTYAAPLDEALDKVLSEL